MASRSFSEALTNLSSEKIKDRTQGLEDVRLFLSVPRNLDWINQDGQRKSWLKLLQAIFQIVVDEQKAYVKKPGAAPALKRLKDSAQAVRLIIEKSAADIPKKAFKAVFNHIVSIIVVKGQLFEPVALEYLKALRTIISYRPHLDHLETKQWTHAIALCFSATLGESIRTYEIVEDQMMEEDQTELTESVGSSNGASKKRKAAGPLRMTAVDEDGYRSGTPTHFRSAGQDVIELMGCIEAFFKSSSSPFVHCGEALLAKFVRFFRTFPGETSAHLPALVALNRLVGELYYNSRRALEAASVHLWPYILSLWNTKNTLIKEQLVIVLTALLPYLLHRTGPAQTPLVQELYLAILAEPENRWGTEDLDMDCLALGKVQTSREEAFQARLLRAGHTFSATQALAWAVLELGAACLKHLQEVSQSLQPNLPPTPSNKGKRRKLDAPLDNLLDDLKSTSPRTVCNRSQLLLFYCEAIPNRGLGEHTVSILEGLTSLLPHENANVQMWAMLAICTLTNDTATAVSAETAPLWAKAWTIALRRLAHPLVSRLACLVLCTLMTQDRVPKAQILADIEGLAKDIEISGPPFPSDAVCGFLISILDLAATDVRLFRLNVQERIYNRLANQWTLLPSSSATSRTFSHKPHSDPLSTSSVFLLLCRIASLPPGDQPVADETVRPDSAISRYKTVEAEHVGLHNWFFHATLPPLGRDNASAPSQIQPGQNLAATTNMLAIRIVSCLRKALESALAEIEGGGDSYWAGLNVDRMRRILDIAVLALLFDAQIECSNLIRADRNFGHVIRILGELVPRINLGKWSVWEKSHLLTGFVPLLVTYGLEASTFEALVLAGRNSGIREDVLAKVGKPPSQATSSRVVPAHLAKLWENQTFRLEMSKMATNFQEILSVDIEEPQLVTTRDDEDFGPIRTTTSTQMTGRAMFDVACETATYACLSISTRLLVTISYFEEGTKPARLKTVVKNLLDGTGSQFALVGKHVFEAVEAGYLALSTTELDDILDRIGGELLPSYEYARSEDVQLLVLKFLQATVLTWGKEDIMEMGFVDNARKLSAWFTAQLLTDNISSPSIRIAFIELLDCFVSRGLSSNAWGHETEELACSEGVPIPPVTILIDMLSDADFRARFKLAPVLGRLCSYVHDKQQQEYSVWESIAGARGFDLTGAGFESNISLLLAYANILVASDFFRSNAYNPLIVYAALDPSKSTSRYVSATLSSTASRLGMRDLAELYTFLAPYTMAEQLLARQEGLVIPDPTAFGFATKRDLYEARFAEVAAMVLAGPRPAFFEQMCTFVGRPVKVALRQCLPVFIGYKLTLPTDPNAESNGQVLEVDQVGSQVAAVAKEAGHTPTTLLKGMQDTVVARLFSFIWEPDYEVGLIDRTFGNEWPGSGETIKDILGTTLGVFRPNVLSPPDVPLTTVLKVLRSPHPALVGALRNEAVLYGILHRLLVMVSPPPFVSQQRRLLYNVAICIAAATGIVSTRKSLLHLILHRVVRLLPQPDLFTLASLIFRWALRKYIFSEHDEASPEDNFSQLLVKAAEIAHGVLVLPASERSDAASNLMKDLENSVEQILSKKAHPLAQQAYDALTLWPTSTSIHRKLTVKHFERTILNPRIKFQNFCILPHLLSAIVTKATGATGADLPRLLWHFLSKIEPRQVLEDGNADSQAALADLLLLADCHLRAPSLDEVRSQGKAEAPTYAAVRDALVTELANLLDDQNLEVITLSYDAIKAILAMPPSASDPITIPPNASMLAVGAVLQPATATVRVPGNLEDLLKGDAWVKKAGERHLWQREFALLLVGVLASTDHFFSHLSPTIQSIPAFANASIPYLVHAMLLQEAQQPNTNAKRLLSAYFERLLKAKAANTADIITLSTHLRAYKPPHDDTGMEAILRDSWLAVPWGLLADGAVRVHAFSAALLFLELSREHAETISSLAISAAATIQQSPEVQRLLYDIYANVDEPDGFYSIAATDLQHGLLRRLHHEGKWMEALAWHAGGLESGLSFHGVRPDSGGITQALAMSDLSHLAMDLFVPASTEAAGQSNNLHGLEYDLAWKTENWDLPLTFTGSQQSSQANFFYAIRASQRDVNRTSANVSISARLTQELAKLAVITAESPATDAAALKAVMSMRELQRWSLQGFEDTEGAREHTHALSRLPYGKRLFVKEPLLSYAHLRYDVSEQALTTRALLLRSARREASRNAIGDELTPLQSTIVSSEKEHLLALARRARESGHLQSALNAVLKAQQFWDVERKDHGTEMETAQIMWHRGEHITSINLLRRMHEQSKVDQAHLTGSEEACLLAQLGEWIGTARLESALDIRQKYFEPAHDLLDSVTDPPGLAAMSVVAIKYATFCDQHYQSSHQQLADIDRLDAYSRRKEMEGKQLRATAKATQSTSGEVQSRHRLVILQSTQDRETVHGFRTGRQTLLETALRMYGRALSLSDSLENAIFRFCSLWLANASDDEVNAIVGAAFDDIPSHKTVTLVHQLSARLATGASATSSPNKPTFQAVLYGLVRRLCVDHPYHTLFQIYFLRSNAPSGKSATASRRISQALPEISSQIQRAEAVSAILNDIRKEDRLRTVTRHVENAITAYTDWAAYNVPKEKEKTGKKARDIPPDQRILELANIPIPVSTIPLPLDKSCRYDPSTFACIRSFKPTFTTAGGIHLPKITDCLGTDGKAYRQLYKGGDDVRQDAVMEQVFGVANDMLRRDEKTKSRNLAVRTYKVIPLTSDAGLLEFVSNSQAIGEWLVKAHDKYNPRDVRIVDARKRLQEMQHETTNERVAGYVELMKKVHPVMRHFFTEKHYVPARWFEMRLLYSRSVAVMSMVGHVLGLGDRHVSNIMVDTAKGELIPIDLGIAFEAGKQLPTPELVPFRLTPDIVDGFGLSGVEGVFRKCSEETMRVLRAQSSVLMTILEVFKFDPLQKWTVSTQKAKRVQGSQAIDRGRVDGINEDGEVLTDADRAIATVATKLSNELSVEYQVNALILQATDAENLGTIFHGWQPYL